MDTKRIFCITYETWMIPLQQKLNFWSCGLDHRCQQRCRSPLNQLIEVQNRTGLTGQCRGAQNMKNRTVDTLKYMRLSSLII